jgi:hypothetical protein
VKRKHSAPQAYIEKTLPLLPSHTQVLVSKATTLFMQSQYGPNIRNKGSTKQTVSHLKRAIRKIKRTYKKADH